MAAKNPANSAAEYLRQRQDAMANNGDRALATDITTAVEAGDFAFRMIGAGERGVRWQRSKESSSPGMFSWLSNKGRTVEGPPSLFVFNPLRGGSQGK